MFVPFLLNKLKKKLTSVYSAQSQNSWDVVWAWEHGQTNCLTKDNLVPKIGLIFWIIFHLNPGNIWYGSTLQSEPDSCEIVTGSLLSQVYKLPTEASKLLSQVTLQPNWLCHPGKTGRLRYLKMTNTDRERLKRDLCLETSTYFPPYIEFCFMVESSKIWFSLPIFVVKYYVLHNENLFYSSSKTKQKRPTVVWVRFWWKILKSWFWQWDYIKIQALWYRKIMKCSTVSKPKCDGQVVNYNFLTIIRILLSQSQFLWTIFAMALQQKVQSY